MEDSGIFLMTYSKVNDMAYWLSNSIFSEFKEGEISAWIFGSSVCKSADSHDCDVFILIHENGMDKLAQLSLLWKQTFENQFGIPLHLTRLSTQESQSAQSFMEAIFSKPTIQLCSR